MQAGSLKHPVATRPTALWSHTVDRVLSPGGWALPSMGQELGSTYLLLGSVALPLEPCNQPASGPSVNRAEKGNSGPVPLLNCVGAVLLRLASYFPVYRKVNLQILICSNSSVFCASLFIPFQYFSHTLLIVSLTHVI